MNAEKNKHTGILTTLIITLVLSFQTQAYEPNASQVAPDFSIKQLDGREFKLSDFKGKQSVYLVFWNTWCHYCMKKIPKLQAAQANLSQDIKIIAVNTSRDDSVQESLDFKKRFNIHYTLAFDQGEKITDLYNVHGVPTEFIIDINGIIKHRDGVPDNLKDYVGLWNQISNNMTQFIKNGVNTLTHLFKTMTQYI